MRTNPNVPLREGVTMFLVPRDTPGFRVGKVFNKSGWRFYQNGEMIFENARVPHANIVGEVNGAYKGRSGDSSGDIFGDLELAANALGLCDAACEQSVELARTKTQGGRPAERTADRSAQDQQNVRAHRSAALIRAARRLRARSESAHAECGLVMNFSTDVIQEVAELNMDIHDAAGYGDANADKTRGATRSSGRISRATRCSG